MKMCNKKSGATLLIVVIFFFSITMIILASATSSALAGASAHRAHTSSKFAYVASESIMEDAFYRIYNNQMISATESLSLNGASGSVNGVNISASEIDLYATGLASERVRKQYLKTTKTGGILSLNYAVQAGDTGATLSAGSSVFGNVFASGVIAGANTPVMGSVTIASPFSPDVNVESTGCVVDEMPGQLNPKIDYAQSFVPTSTEAFAKVSLYIKKVGAPATQSVKIVSDSVGSPSATALATTVLNAASAGTSYGWVDITFATPPTLATGTRYWIVLDAGTDASNYWYWCRSSSDSYADGSSKYTQDWTLGPWTLVANEDMAFQTYWGVGESRATSLRVTGIVKADSITISAISGDAYYKTIYGSTVSGSSVSSSPTPPDIASPLTSATIAKWKADAKLGGTRVGEYRVTSGVNTYGPKYITGDLRIEDSILIVSGTLYAEGFLRIENSTVRCAPAYGANSCVIFSEKWDRMKDGGSFLGSGTAGSHIVIGTNAVGTLDIEHNPTGIILLAPNGTVNAMNNAIFKSILAKRLILGGTSIVSYEASLASMNIAASTVSGSSSFWGVTRWNTR